MGQTRDAIEAYVSASQLALARGDQGESEKLADKALKLEPSNLAAVIIKARSHSSQGNLTKATQLLEQAAGLEKGGEQTELLLDLYLKNSDWDEASALAHRVFEADQKNLGRSKKVVESVLQSGNGQKAREILEKSGLAMIDAGEHEVVAKLLTELAVSLPGSVVVREWLVELYGRNSDSFHIADALAHLGDALVADQQYERAKKTFEQLVDRDPESDSAKRKLNHVLRKMGVLEGGEAEDFHEENLRAESPHPPAARLPVEDEESAAEAPPKPAVKSSEPALDDETQKFIAQSLTDVDLFASYGLTQKAIGLLEAILRRAPHHTPTLEKLLDFVLGAGDDRRTAELAAQLEQLHTQSGDVRSAERFGELRRRFQRAAGLSDADLMPAQAVAPEAPAAPPAAPDPEELAVPEPEPPAAEEVHEVDLSDEWASMLKESRAAEPAAKSPKAPAEAAPEFDIPVEAAAVPENTNPFAESSADIPVDQGLPEIGIRREAHESASIFEKNEVPPVAPAEPLVHADDKASRSQKAKPKPKAPKPEFEVDQEYELVLDATPLVPAHEQKPPAGPPAPRKPQSVPQNAAPAADDGFASDQFLADLAKEIDQLGLSALPSAPPAPSTRKEKPAAGKNSSKPAAAAPSRSAIESGPLKEVFDEFRAELGEMGAEEEDLETHYNLGTAFREMGLLEESISEFQKDAKPTERGRPVPYVMQCCTLLGLSFIEKGQPGAC